MARPKIEVNENLRTLIRVSRTHARLTQVQAAEKAGISEVWWSQVETGIKDTVTLDTMTSMLMTVNAPVHALRKMGFDNIADSIRQQQDWFGSEAL